MREPLKIKMPPTLEQKNMLALLNHEVGVMHALMDMDVHTTDVPTDNIRAFTVRLEGIDHARLRVAALEQRIMKLEAQRS